MALESSILTPPSFISPSKSFTFYYYNKNKSFPTRVSLQTNRHPLQFVSNSISTSDFRKLRFLGQRCEKVDLFPYRVRLRALGNESGGYSGANCEVSGSAFDALKVVVKCGVVLGAMVCGVLVVYGGSRRAFAVEGSVVNAAGYGIVDRSLLMLKNAWPKMQLVLQVFKDQGLILAALLGLSAFFSMAETSITTLWPWKV